MFEELVWSTLILRSQDEDRTVEELFALLQPEAGHDTNCHNPIGNSNLYEICHEQLICFAEHNSNKCHTQFSSGFSMIFFILALAHAMGIQEMVVRDTEDALEREALEEISSNHLNTKKMDLAHHNATGY